MKLVRRQFLRLEHAIEDVIAAGRRAGEVSTGHSAGVAARTFLSTYYGLRVLGKVGDRDLLLDVVEGSLAAL